ncbi:MAG TPA: sterol desaturase family protein [Ignavibacteriaceae bacterium]|nr:sterol desaturase family protein [Ignavibacteriaceae bacterium]
MAKNFVSNKDETARMFESDFMETFSRVHFSVPLFIYIPVIFFFLYRSIFSYEESVISILTLVILGISMWSLAEYTLHRFLFHFEFKSELGARVHFIFHGVHHDYPNDSRRLVMPPSISIPLALLFYFIFTLILGTMYVAPFFVGFILGYLGYDMTHYAVHHYNMHNRVWLAIKNHHMKHHYMDSTKGFGVSSPIWDEVMGTNFPKKENS